MAQWGAFGFAQKGATYEDILAHYYRNTTLGPAELSKVRVYLAQGRSQLSLGSNAAFTVRDGIGQTWHVAAGTLTFGPGLKIKTTDVQQPQRLPGPLTFIPGTSPLRFGSTAYRGQLQVSVANGRLRAVNLVGLEAYLYGVVPSEMPKDWLPEALKAQAVAARSYALAVRKTGSWFDLYPDTRSQVYLGIAHEAPSTTAAVNAHRRPGRPLPRRGGHDVLLLELGRPYRVRAGGLPERAVGPVPDLGQRSLRHDFAASSLGPIRRLRGSSQANARRARALSDVTLELGPSGRVETITGVGAQGGASMKGWDFRRALDLDSTWFRIGVLSLGNPQGPVTYGKRVSIDGVARSLPSVRLDRRQPGATWQTIGPVTPGPGGSVVIKMKPKMPTDYRLVSGQVRSRVAHVSVAPLVRFRGLVTARRSAAMRARSSRAPASRCSAATADGWTTIARATIDASGNFEAHVNLTPGDYRARLAPGHGFVPGVSTTVKVGPA